jgi:hypothetical protein
MRSSSFTSRPPPSKVDFTSPSLLVDTGGLSLLISISLAPSRKLYEGSQKETQRHGS